MGREGGRGHSSSEADPVTSGGEAQVLRQQPAIDEIPRVEASRKLRRAEPRDGMLKTPKSGASGVTNLGFYVGPRRRLLWPTGQRRSCDQRE